MTPISPSGGLRAVVLSPATRLRGPSTTSSAPAGQRIGLVTGGGLVGVLDPERGLRGLWRETEPWAGGMRVTMGSRPLWPSGGLRSDAGGWTRTLSDPEGNELREDGLLPDVLPVLVMQWSVSEHAGRGRELAVELKTPGASPPLRVTLSVSPAAPAVLAVFPEGLDPERVRRLLQPLRARELQRASRAAKALEPEFQIEVDEHPEAAVAHSLLLLDGAPLSLGVDGAPTQPFLAGFRSGAPCFLSGTALSEVALGALPTGRTGLAHAALEALAREGEPPAIPFLYLAAEWALWTGEPRALLPIWDELVQAVERAGQEPSPPAAFPSLSVTLNQLRAGIEPLGPHYQLPEPPIQLEGDDGFSSSKRIRLPLAGEPSPTKAADPGKQLQRAVLPAPDSFTDPLGPGVLPRRTLQGGRILRAWVEGRLGARPDVSYGRLRLGPQLHRGWKRFRLQGMRAGEGSVSLDYRRSGATCTFLLRQEGGRVPMNLVFEPWIPFSRVDQVLLGGDRADVELQPNRGGVEIHLQFPLDPERRIRIVGAI